ncbi:hypothetical protein OESDEN_08361 [Oesophagostomum dentatum]|uniref:Uncharacterized protein n=1 Tax=Oesophagostomum dentatum TaxID=61180 RepID=A0A0B1T7J0_OESDE|nr:hypothetical protein OESDEN_08361 [Oesophagostomum dentatum]
MSRRLPPLDICWSIRCCVGFCVRFSTTVRPHSARTSRAVDSLLLLRGVSK